MSREDQTSCLISNNEVCHGIKRIQYLQWNSFPNWHQYLRPNSSSSYLDGQGLQRLLFSLNTSVVFDVTNPKAHQNPNIISSPSQYNAIHVRYNINISTPYRRKHNFKQFFFHNVSLYISIISFDPMWQITVLLPSILPMISKVQWSSLVLSEWQSFVEYCISIGRRPENHFKCSLDTVSNKRQFCSNTALNTA